MASEGASDSTGGRPGGARRPAGTTFRRTIAAPAVGSTASDATMEEEVPSRRELGYGMHTRGGQYLKG